MGLDNLIKLAVTLTIAAAMTGHLPQFVREVRIAQVKLLEESKASRWGSPDLIYSKHKFMGGERSQLRSGRNR